MFEFALHFLPVTSYARDTVKGGGVWGGGGGGVGGVGGGNFRLI